MSVHVCTEYVYEELAWYRRAREKKRCKSLIIEHHLLFGIMVWHQQCETLMENDEAYFFNQYNNNGLITCLFKFHLFSS